MSLNKVIVDKMANIFLSPKFHGVLTSEYEKNVPEIYMVLKIISEIECPPNFLFVLHLNNIVWQFLLDHSSF